MMKSRLMSVNKFHPLKVVLIAFFYFSFFLSNAQERVINGTVTDAENGEPLIGVTVIVKDSDSNIGAITDIDGKFSLRVPADADKLLVSSVGFNSQEITIGNQTSFDVSLAADISELDEIVVVAYGEQKKSDVTGAISSTKSEDFNKGVVTNPGQLLQGKVAGVNVTNASGEPGASQNIIIRGVGSLRSGTTPLFVVDGFLLDNTSNGVANNPLNFLNPNDIASIEVLKDASAAALYGSRASNGVVVITTKKGKEGSSQISFSASTAWSSVANEMDVFSADEFRRQVVAIGGVLDDAGGNTDWQDVLTQTGKSQDYSLSLSGASDEFSYFASVGVQQQEGILNASELERYSGKLNMSQSAFDGRVNIDYNVTATRTENLRPAITSTIADMLNLNPTFGAGSESNPEFLPEGRINPLLRNNLYSDEAFNNRLIGRIAPSVEILDGLTYKLNLGIDYSITNRYVQNRSASLSEFSQQGSLNSITSENTNRLVENTLSYNFVNGKHSATLLAGHSYQQFFAFFKSTNQDGFDEGSPIDPLYSDHNSTDLFITTVNSTAERNELQSFFGRLDYSFDSKYLFTATMRADGSSKFGENNKYGYFPSFAAGWNITNEAFFASSVFNNLKLRASWGQTGNQEIPSKITELSFLVGKGANPPQSQLTYPLEDDQLTLDDYPIGIAFTRLPNEDLQWEVSTQTNIGLDFALLDYRLSGTVDFFYKVSDNVILEIPPADPITPTETFWTNIPGLEIENRGLEIALEYSSDPGSDLKWSVGGNLTRINNEVVNSPFSVLTTGSASGAGQTGATINGYINGEPIGAFYMRTFTGIGDDGLSQYADLNNDQELTDDDRSVVGSALPDLTYAFYANMGYKGFDFSVNFNGVSGNEIYNHNRMELFTRGSLSTSNNTTDFAVEFPDESNTNSNIISTRYIEDGSFLRLNNATLGYSITPAKLGLNSAAFTNFRFYVTGQNLFVITDYSGFDPEVNTGNSISGIQTFGIDRLTYPSARTFLIGFTANF